MHWVKKAFLFSAPLLLSNFIWCPLRSSGRRRKKMLTIHSESCTFPSSTHSFSRSKLYIFYIENNGLLESEAARSKVFPASVITKTLDASDWIWDILQEKHVVSHPLPRWQSFPIPWVLLWYTVCAWCVPQRYLRNNKQACSASVQEGQMMGIMLFWWCLVGGKAGGNIGGIRRWTLCIFPNQTLRDQRHLCNARARNCLGMLGKIYVQPLRFCFLIAPFPLGLEVSLGQLHPFLNQFTLEVCDCIIKESDCKRCPSNETLISSNQRTFAFSMSNHFLSSLKVRSLSFLVFSVLKSRRKII